MRENVLSQIKHLQLGDKVHCPGRLEEEELPLWYGAADIYVSSSLSDGSQFRCWRLWLADYGHSTS